MRTTDHTDDVRIGYPFYALAVFAVTVLLCAAEIIVLSLWMMPMVPLIPVFVMILVGNACLLGTVRNWVISLGRPRQRRGTQSVGSPNIQASGESLSGDS